MGIYNIRTDNDSVLQAVVTDDNQVIADSLTKLRASLEIPVVSVEIRYQERGRGRTLVLSSRTFCLLVNYYDDKRPKSVEGLTNDRTICFVAMNPSYLIDCGEVGLWNLAAIVLKKPSLNGCRCLKTLAGEVGVQWRQPPKLADEKEVSNRCGNLFSQEEMEFLVHQAYCTSVVGAKLLGSLEE